MRIIQGKRLYSKSSILSKLNADERVEASKLEDLEAELVIAENRVKAFKDKCNHLVLQIINKNDIWEHNPLGLDDALCLVCKRDFGWACSVSGDGACHYGYEINAGVLMLNDRREVRPVEKDYTFSDEECVFCGAPEERK